MRVPDAHLRGVAAPRDDVGRDQAMEGIMFYDRAKIFVQAGNGGNGLSDEGGGGGGGGGGYIQANKALTDAKVSPMPNIVQ